MIPGSNQSFSGWHTALPTMNGDPLSQMEILPSIGSGIRGGTFGYTRINNDGSPKFHDGMDFVSEVGTSVYNIKDGIVTKTVSTQIQGLVNYKKNKGDTNGAGNRIYIKSGTLTLVYWHLSEVNVNVGDTIPQGKIIGLTGSTGNANSPGSSGPHLHLNAKLNGVSVNPANYIKTKF